MNPKYQKVCADIAKLEGKAADIQKQLGELYDKKTELENLEIASTRKRCADENDSGLAWSQRYGNNSKHL